MSDSNHKGAGTAFGESIARGLLVIMLCAVTVLVVAPAALAQGNADQKGASEDETRKKIEKEEAAKLDCSDFATQRGAQAILSRAPFSAGEDRFDLDEDGDGVACEAQGGDAEDGSKLGADTGEDRDCADFPSQKAAQADLRADPSDPDKLDPDRNGVACEFLAAPYEDGALDETPVAEARSSADLNCKDFEYQQEAQAVYLRDKSDPNDLDAVAEDGRELAGNGFVCEDLQVLESNVELVRAEGTREEAAPWAPAALVAAWPHGGGLGLLLDLVALLLVSSGLLTLLAVRRRVSGS